MCDIFSTPQIRRKPLFTALNGRITTCVICATASAHVRLFAMSGFPDEKDSYRAGSKAECVCYIITAAISTELPQVPVPSRNTIASFWSPGSMYQYNLVSQFSMTYTCVLKLMYGGTRQVTKLLSKMVNRPANPLDSRRCPWHSPIFAGRGSSAFSPFLPHTRVSHIAVGLSVTKALVEVVAPQITIFIYNIPLNDGITTLSISEGFAIGNYRSLIGMISGAT